MEKLIVDEICKNLNWRDKVVVKMFKGTFARFYNDVRIIIFNKMNV